MSLIERVRGRFARAPEEVRAALDEDAEERALAWGERVDGGWTVATSRGLRVVPAGSGEDATLLAILQALGVAPKVLAQEKGTLGRRDLEQRIKKISAEVEAGEAVSRAVATMNSAIPVVISDGGGDGGDGGGGD